MEERLGKDLKRGDILAIFDDDGTFLHRILVTSANPVNDVSRDLDDGMYVYFLRLDVTSERQHIYGSFFAENDAEFHLYKLPPIDNVIGATTEQQHVRYV